MVELQKKVRVWDFRKGLGLGQIQGGQVKKITLYQNPTNILNFQKFELQNIPLNGECSLSWSRRTPISAL